MVRFSSRSALAALSRATRPSSGRRRGRRIEAGAEPDEPVGEHAGRDPVALREDLGHPRQSGITPAALTARIAHIFANLIDHHPA